MTFEHGVILFLIALLAIEKYCNYLELKAERKIRVQLAERALEDARKVWVARNEAETSKPSSIQRTKKPEDSEEARLDPVLGNDW